MVSLSPSHWQRVFVLFLPFLPDFVVVLVVVLVVVVVAAAPPWPPRSA